MDILSMTATAGLILAVMGFLLFRPTGLVKWLQKKNYQYEVTFSLYMLTPTEKFVFNSILFLTLSMFTIACTVYLPDHIATMSRRAYYYFAGETGLGDMPWQAADSLGSVASKASDTVLVAATDMIGNLSEAAVHTAKATQEAVARP